jgi:hypothetical protein
VISIPLLALPPEAVRLVGELAQYDAALASVNEPFLDTTAAMGRGIFGLFAAMAEQESENISQRTKATKDILRRAGSFAGGQRPYGCRFAQEARDGLTLTVLRRDDEEAAVVSGIVSRVMAGASVTSGAKRLNVAGIKSSTGEEWSVSTLSRLLRSPTLAAAGVHRREHRPPGSSSSSATATSTAEPAGGARCHGPVRSPCARPSARSASTFVIRSTADCPIR